MAMPKGTVMALTKSGGIGGEGAWATIGIDFADMFGLVRPRPREGRVGPLHPPALEIAGSVVDIADQPSRGTAVCDVLAAWRAAERELAALSVDSPEWSEVRGKVLELRASYHQLFSEHLHRWPGT
jgi:hypothetical protein